MSVHIFGKLAGIAALALGLSACVDVNIDVALTSTTTARATMTQTMSPDLYAMAKSARETEGGEVDFCAEGTLTENSDGSATCTIAEEGPFADLDLGQDEDGITFADAGAGLVRISLPTATLTSELGADGGMDEETRQMALAFFEGHDITVSFSGLEITDTNMTRSADGKSASQAISLSELVEGTLELPPELYAVVRAP